MAESCYLKSEMFIVILIITMTSGSMNPVDAARVSITAETKNERDWCIAKVGTTDQALTDILRDVCEHNDCSPIAPGGPCYYPDTLSSHASFAMNRFFQTWGPHPHAYNCIFGNNGIIVHTDPSYGNCTYDLFH